MKIKITLMNDSDVIINERTQLNIIQLTSYSIKTHLIQIYGVRMAGWLTNRLID